MSDKKYHPWTKVKMSADEILYWKYGTPKGYGGPHPYKAPDEIRRRIAQTVPAFHHKMRLALKYAMRVRLDWIKQLKSEDTYLRSRGWTTKPYEHSEYMGDHDTWVSPRRFGRDYPAGYEMSRMGAMGLQCSKDGHAPKEIKMGPGIPLLCCSRCGAAFARVIPPMT